ncbi:MAG TPA: DUF1634 domain-containing protein [Edaphocola sp.]|nr:DUF1634 domain-containing protein [Edaphocola sp.]
MEANKQKKDLELIISNTLRIGVWSAFWIALLGVVMLIFANGALKINTQNLPEIPQKFSFEELWKGLMNFDAHQIAMLGVFLLLITPLIRVIFALIAYTKQKNIMYVWITFIVLLIIGISIWIGAVH